jgi:RimJ/RimL family protein N-acetyltransferase
MIEGKLVYLSAVDKENAETFRRWVNDPDTNRWLATGHVPLTADDERRRLEEIDTSDTDYLLEIHVKEDDRLIGIVGLHRLNVVHRRGEMGLTIGEPDERGKGYGRDAVETGLRFAFDTLGLHGVGLYCVTAHEAGMALYRGAGFREIGVIPEAMFMHGRFWDVALFYLLEDGFRERYGESE